MNFIDALIEVQGNSRWYSDTGRMAALDVLEMPEMVAIHRFINARLDEVLGNRVGDAPAVKWLSERGLPESVIGWVLDV